MQAVPRLPDIVINASEFSTLARAAERFTTLSLIVLESQKAPYWAVLRELNDLRPFLQRFSKIMKDNRCPDPIELLNTANNRDYGHMAKILAMSNNCAAVAIFLGRLLTIGLAEQLRRHPPQEQQFKIDPKKLN